MPLLNERSPMIHPVRQMANSDSDPAVITSIIEQREADGLDLYDIEYGDGVYFATFLDELEGSSPFIEKKAVDS